MFGKKLTAIALTCSLVACADEITTETPEGEQATHNWKMTSTFGSATPLLGTFGKLLPDHVKLATGGSVTIKFHEPGVLAPALESFDAVQYGAIEAAWSTSGYWAGKVPALQLFSSMPFGPPAAEYLAWYDHGGGRELFEDIYHKHNIHSIICGVTPPESSGWYKKEMKSLKDFENLKIRFFGLGGRVLERVGASPQLIAGGEIYQALELGAIDATEYAFPSVDLSMGFYQVADHYYFPGWHQQSTLFEFMINLDAWNALSDTQQAQIDMACSANVRLSLSEGEAMQAKALEAIAAKGVNIHTWPPEILEELEGHWQAVVVELSDSDEDFKRVWDSLVTFRASYRGWFDRGYLKD